jgi:hypothetical protein
LWVTHLHILKRLPIQKIRSNKGHLLFQGVVLPTRLERRAKKIRRANEKDNNFDGEISVLSFLFAVESFAQRGMKWQGSGNWGAGTEYGRLYNSQSMETISGEVASVDTITPIKGMSSGVHLMGKTDKETISVHLGPAWYIQRQDMKIVPGDKVEIAGSRISFQGQPAIIAAEVKKGTEILKLRDENGFPVWSGWRRR